MPDTSTQRSRRTRGHAAGDHSICSPEHCHVAADLEYRNMYRLYARALFTELERQHISAEKFLGARYQEIREIADTELPDYLQSDPDYIDLFRARIDIADNEIAI